MLKIAKQEDFQTIKDMAMKFFKYSPYENFPSNLELVDLYIKSFLEDNPFKIVVMDVDLQGNTTGFIAFEYGAYLFSPVGCGIEKALWVEPQYRQSNIAEKLLEAFEEWAKELKCSILQLSSLETKEAKMLDKFYKKKGYVKVENTYLKELKGN